LSELNHCRAIWLLLCCHLDKLRTRLQPNLLPPDPLPFNHTVKGLLHGPAIHSVSQLWNSIFHFVQIAWPMQKQNG